LSARADHRRRGNGKDLVKPENLLIVKMKCMIRLAMLFNGQAAHAFFSRKDYEEEGED